MHVCGKPTSQDFSKIFINNCFTCRGNRSMTLSTIYHPPLPRPPSIKTHVSIVYYKVPTCRKGGKCRTPGH